jgi:hypothetical protein
LAVNSPAAPAAIHHGQVRRGWVSSMARTTPFGGQMVI